MKRRRLRLMLGVVVVGSVAGVSLGEFDYIAGDPLAYHDLTGTVVSGSIPYVQGQFEHLPLMLVPMLLAWFLGGSASPFAYRAVWVVLSALVLFACHRQVEEMDQQLDRSDGFARVWVALVSPLVPIALFRNDLWSLLPALVAMRLAWSRPGRSAVASAIGALAKGWPIVILWAIRRRPRVAVSTAIAVFAALGVVAQLPGFRSGREFDGLHSETLGGSIYALREWLLVVPPST